MGTEFQFYKMKRGWMVVTVAQHYECISYHWTVHLKMVKMVNFIITCMLLQLKKLEKKKRKPTSQCPSGPSSRLQPPRSPLSPSLRPKFFFLVFSLMM